jgi:CspA family cold shock protein
MATGTVKWFDPLKGFGFITPDIVGPDIFFHHSIIPEYYKDFEEGDKVQFEIVVGTEGPGGLQAADLVRIG